MTAAESVSLHSFLALNLGSFKRWKQTNITKDEDEKEEEEVKNTHVLSRVFFLSSSLILGQLQKDYLSLENTRNFHLNESERVNEQSTRALTCSREEEKKLYGTVCSIKIVDERFVRRQLLFFIRVRVRVGV